LNDLQPQPDDLPSRQKAAEMLPYVARKALSRTSLKASLLLRPSVRLAHTQRRTLPEFSLDGKVAVGKRIVISAALISANTSQ
jgi:hypothetical protein